ncbi:MAG TPA: LamG-like jellyroll fold domain-containing protein, partial [Lacipirellulaceae bacterium]|nr:LamG-like jellyroll fold domain-containing protein [Lacipirellulaceae bacterium]
DLNLVGDAGFAASVNPGLGTALSTDGSGDGAIAPNFVKITTNNMTAVAWVNATSLDGDWNSIVKNWGSTVGGQFHFGLGSVAANTLQSIAAGATNLAAPGNLPANEWVHVGFVLDSTGPQHRLYINGAQVATAAYTGTLGLGTATGLGVGHKPNNDGTALDAGGGPGPWNGRIDEVGLYNEALSAAQIQTIYQNGLAGRQLDGTSVPEPATLGGLLLGCVSAVAGIRRRGK